MYSGNTRHPFLDYRQPGIFMITMLKRDEVPRFSEVIFNDKFSDVTKKASARFCPLGQVIRRSLKEFQEINSNIGILQHAIMPDHVHFIVRIKETLEQSLGIYLARLKVDILHKAREEKAISPNINSIFTKNYNDSYLHPKRSLQDLISYVKTNPWRYWEKKNHPEFFTRIDEYILSDERCRVYGNIRLLENPFIYPVIYHRRYTGQTWDRFCKIYSYVIDNGGVLVGSFVNPNEKKILDESLASGGKIILFQDIPDSPRWKPYKRNFELATAGNFLQIHPYRLKEINPTRKLNEKYSRAECLFMNKLGESLIKLNPSPKP